MKRTFLTLGVIGGLTVYGALPALATEISAKLKSAKVQGDLVPAFACVPYDPGTGVGDPSTDCSGSVQVSTCDSDSGADAGKVCSGLLGPCAPEHCVAGNITASKADGNDCTFDKGTFKVQTGKDVQVQILGLKCNGAVPTGLCSHMVTYSTIANQNIPAKGDPTPVTCPDSALGNVAGTSNFAVTNLGVLTCDSKGKCKGVMPQVISDPCPGADEITQVARLQVFDDSKSANADIPIPGSGSSVKLVSCCGPNQEVIPGVAASNYAACNTSPKQAVLATMGYVKQLK